MANPFYNYIPQQANPIAELMQEVQRLKANPAQYFMQRNLNIPNDISNDPNAIMSYLLATGQRTQAQVNDAYQFLSNQGRRIAY